MRSFFEPTYITKGEAVKLLGLSRVSQLADLGLKTVATAVGPGFDYHLLNFQDVASRVPQDRGQRVPRWRAKSRT